MTRTEQAVLSQALCDFPDLPAAQQRAFGAAIARMVAREERLTHPTPGYAESVAAGYVDLGEFDPELYGADGRPL